MGLPRRYQCLGGRVARLAYVYRVLYSTHMSDWNRLGEVIRDQREALRQSDAQFSLRRVADRIGVEPSYLSKVERGITPPPSEETLRRLAAELDLDADVLLALAGKVSSDLQEVIRRRPQLFAQLIRELKDLPDHAVLRLVREVRDGEW
jgi:HTH-type transcriptional regulator, competence development regulator